MDHSLLQTAELILDWAESNPLHGIAKARRIWLFLDYDGTLAPFSPVRDPLLPDREIVEILRQSFGLPAMRTAVISGRRMSDLQTLLPVPGIFLAGVYGIELSTPAGESIHRVENGSIRPVLERLKLQWEEIIVGQKRFFLDDKGWSLALHTRFTARVGTGRIMSEAEQAAGEWLTSGQFRLLTGPTYLEVAPSLAHKGEAVHYLLRNFPWPDALPIYIGDTALDREAFEIIHSYGGIAILVSDEESPSPSTGADYYLASTRDVRSWLKKLFRLRKRWRSPEQ